MDESIEVPPFKNIEDECAFWKTKYNEVRQKLAEVKHDYTDFEENSRELEAELEATLEQRDKTIRDLKSSLNQIQNDNESLRKKINTFEVDYNSLEKRHTDLNGEHERLRDHVRKVEQINDDLERTNRVVSATVSDLEAMLTEAYEKNQLLESEVEDKETLTERHQRVLDELRDLKQEINVKKPSVTTQQSNDIHSENELNGNSKPNSQRALSIIADSLRRIDIMAAKLKACQEISVPNGPLNQSDYFAQQRHIHSIMKKTSNNAQQTAANQHSLSSLNNTTLLTNGSINLSNLSLSMLNNTTAGEINDSKLNETLANKAAM